jgi:hypothetical protein
VRGAVLSESGAVLSEIGKPVEAREDFSLRGPFPGEVALALGASAGQTVVPYRAVVPAVPGEIARAFGATRAAGDSWSPGAAPELTGGLGFGHAAGAMQAGEAVRSAIRI